MTELAQITRLCFESKNLDNDVRKSHFRLGIYAYDDLYRYFFSLTKRLQEKDYSKRLCLETLFRRQITNVELNSEFPDN